MEESALQLITITHMEYPKYSIEDLEKLEKENKHLRSKVTKDSVALLTGFGLVITVVLAALYFEMHLAWWWVLIMMIMVLVTLNIEATMDFCFMLIAKIRRIPFLEYEECLAIDTVRKNLNEIKRLCKCIQAANCNGNVYELYYIKEMDAICLFVGTGDANDKIYSFNIKRCTLTQDDKTNDATVHLTGFDEAFEYFSDKLSPEVKCE